MGGSKESPITMDDSGVPPFMENSHLAGIGGLDELVSFSFPVHGISRQGPCPSPKASVSGTKPACPGGSGMCDPAPPCQLCIHVYNKRLKY